MDLEFKIGIIGVTCISLLLFIVLWWVSIYKCSVQSEAMGMKGDYGLIQGCMIETPKGKVPLGQYRVID